MIKKIVLLSLLLVFLLGYFFYKKAVFYTELFGYSLSGAVNLLIKSNLLATGMDLKYYHKPTILILGVDERNDKLEHTEVTDTIMLAQLNLLKNTISVVSLPRDTWD
jgi:anionic cell wall polymer biosynthesis LytR-Cps2A-Psr (LCP) family protein